MKPSDLLKLAEAAPGKSSLEDHRHAILVLRDKGYTWREIALFLSEKGVSADHTSVYRLVTKQKNSKPKMNTTIPIPKAAEYASALLKMTIHPSYRKMLKAHYDAHNRSITYAKLNEAAEWGNGAANLHYGLFGRKLGDKLGFKFDKFVSEPDKEWVSSAIGMPNSYVSGEEEFEIIMHHELAKALQENPSILNT